MIIPIGKGGRNYLQGVFTLENESHRSDDYTDNFFEKFKI